MNLLHHEMLIATLFGSFCIPFDRNQIFLDLIAIQIVKCCLTISQTTKFHIPNVINISCIFQNSRNIRCDIAISISNTNNHRTVFSCNIDFIWILFKHHCKCIRTTNTNHRMINRIYRCMFIFLVIVIHKLHGNFCIG